ncbi:MAG: hypothetical protein ABS977_19795 [Pseudomonas qingdaonensis]|uniref:hypothetical protein n=1 Tax=Pseudomonas qingdaonensis TaxID=2056231 RepID=UPI003314E976
MLSIASNPLNSAATQLKPPVAKTNVDGAQSAQPAEAPAKEGVRVNLSLAGLQASKSSGGNKDIEESGLPQTIQQTLKTIRKLQQQLAEKMQQMQAVMRDNSLTPEQMRQKVSSLQGEIATLTGAITTATANLNKAMKQENLSLDQVAKVFELMG